MKKIIIILSVLAATLFAASCNKTKEVQPVAISVQLMSEGEAFAVEGVTINLTDAAATFSLDENTNAQGRAAFSVKPGSYTAKATYTTSENGVRMAYTGQASVAVSAEAVAPYELNLQKVESQQIVIKEVYSTQCPKSPSGAYGNDAYIVLYNNSDVEADATNIAIGMLAPYNAQGTNKYYNADDVLIYENDTWVPAAGGIWSFTSQVTIPPYSQIVIALYGAINHTATEGLEASVDLSDPSYYWMQKNEQYTNAKYQVAETIPTTHYLSCAAPINMGNAWLFSNSSPSLFIANMPKAQVEALSKDTANFDTTGGTTNTGWAAKFPQANIIGAVDVWAADKLETSKLRFPAKINSGYVAITGKLGYTVYRNVDKEATEALPENDGKLVYGYTGTYDEATGAGSTDPSGIDAEASIAKGAHIIYKQTNSSANDFHQRKVASIKK